jgi:hypothetical protein
MPWWHPSNLSNERLIMVAGCLTGLAGLLQMKQSFETIL